MQRATPNREGGKEEKKRKVILDQNQPRDRNERLRDDYIRCRIPDCEWPFGKNACAPSPLLREGVNDAEAGRLGGCCPTYCCRSTAAQSPVGLCCELGTCG